VPASTPGAEKKRKHHVNFLFPKGKLSKRASFDRPEVDVDASDSDNNAATTEALATSSNNTATSEVATEALELAASSSNTAAAASSNMATSEVATEAHEVSAGATTELETLAASSNNTATSAAASSNMATSAAVVGGSNNTATSEVATEALELAASSSNTTTSAAVVATAAGAITDVAEAAARMGVAKIATFSTDEPVQLFPVCYRFNFDLDLYATGLLGDGNREPWEAQFREASLRNNIIRQVKEKILEILQNSITDLRATLE
jgi:hypothetical protein